MKRGRIISRHRLPRFYRVSLVVLWGAPAVLLSLTAVISRGVTAALFDPRFWLPLALMLLPAWYIWREGMDVLTSGIITRVHWPCYYSYDQLDNWYYDPRPDKRVLTVWDTRNRKVWQIRAGHLSNLTRLLGALNANLRNRKWPT